MDTALYVNNVGKQLNWILKTNAKYKKYQLVNLVLINHLSKLISDLNPYNVTMSYDDRLKIQGFIANLKKDLPYYNHKIN